MRCSNNPCSPCDLNIWVVLFYAEWLTVLDWDAIELYAIMETVLTLYALLAAPEAYSHLYEYGQCIAVVTDVVAACSSTNCYVH